MFTKSIFILNEKNEITQEITFIDYDGKYKQDFKKIDNINKISSTNESKSSIEENFFDNMVFGDTINNFPIQFKSKLYFNKLNMHLPLYISVYQLINILSSLLSINVNNILVYDYNQNNSTFLILNNEIFYKKYNYTNIVIDKYTDNREFILNIASFTPLYKICIDENNQQRNFYIRVYSINRNNKDYNIFTSISNISIKPIPSELSFILELSKKSENYINKLPNFVILSISKMYIIRSIFSLNSKNGDKILFDPIILSGWKKIYKKFIMSILPLSNNKIDYIIYYNDEWTSISEEENNLIISNKIKLLKKNNFSTKDIYIGIKNISNNVVDIQLNIINGIMKIDMLNSSDKFYNFEDNNKKFDEIYKDISGIFKNYIINAYPKILTNINIKKNYFKKNADIKQISNILDNLNFIKKPEETGITSEIYYIYNDMTEYMLAEIFKRYKDNSMINIYNYFITNNTYQSIENTLFGELKLKQFSDIIEISLSKISTTEYLEYILKFINSIITNLGYEEYDNNYNISSKTDLKHLINNDPVLFGKIGNNVKTRYSLSCQGKDKQPILTGNIEDSIGIYNQSKVGQLDYYKCNNNIYSNLQFKIQKNRCILCCGKEKIQDIDLESFYCKYKLQKEFDDNIYRNIIMKNIEQYSGQYNENIAPGKTCMLNKEINKRYINNDNIKLLALPLYDKISFYDYIDISEQFLNKKKCNTVILDLNIGRNFINEDFNNNLESRIIILSGINTFLVLVDDKNSKGYTIFYSDTNEVNLGNIKYNKLTYEWFNKIKIDSEKKLNIQEIKTILNELKDEEENDIIDIIYVDDNDKVIKLEIDGIELSVDEIKLDVFKFKYNDIIFIGKNNNYLNIDINNLDQKENLILYDNIKTLLYCVMFYSCFIDRDTIFNKNKKYIDTKLDKRIVYGINNLNIYGKIDLYNFKITETGYNYITDLIKFRIERSIDNIDIENEDQKKLIENVIKLNILYSCIEQ